MAMPTARKAIWQRPRRSRPILPMRSPTTESSDYATHANDREGYYVRELPAMPVPTVRVGVQDAGQLLPARGQRVIQRSLAAFRSQSTAQCGHPQTTQTTSNTRDRARVGLATCRRADRAAKVQSALLPRSADARDAIPALDIACRRSRPPSTYGPTDFCPSTGVRSSGRRDRPSPDGLTKNARGPCTTFPPSG